VVDLFWTYANLFYYANNIGNNDFFLFLNIIYYLVILLSLFICKYEVVDFCFEPMQIYLHMYVILERLEFFEEQNKESVTELFKND